MTIVSKLSAVNSYTSSDLSYKANTGSAVAVRMSTTCSDGAGKFLYVIEAIDYNILVKFYLFSSCFTFTSSGILKTHTHKLRVHALVREEAAHGRMRSAPAWCNLIGHISHAHVRIFSPRMRLLAQH